MSSALLAPQPLDHMNLLPASRVVIHSVYLELEQRTPTSFPHTSADMSYQLRTCRTINHEVQSYLSKLSPTFHCLNGHRPSVLHRLPRSTLRRASTAILEDHCMYDLNLNLLTGITTVCLVRTLESKLLDSIRPQLRGMNLNEIREHVLPLPSNNELLKSSHAWWTDLRAGGGWIHSLWKDRKDIKVILRTVMELEISNKFCTSVTTSAAFVDWLGNPIMEEPPMVVLGNDNDGGPQLEDVVFSYHCVVDAQAGTLIEMKPLPDRRVGEEAEFSYDGGGWWKQRPE